jgi:hypothetical protein
MKIILTLSCVLFCIVFSYSQADSIKYKISESKLEHIPTPPLTLAYWYQSPSIIGENENHLFTFFLSRWKTQINVYDTNTLIKSNKIVSRFSLFYTTRHFEDAKLIGNNLCLFYSRYDKKEREKSFFCETYDAKTLELKEEELFLIKIHAEKYYHGQMKLILSEDQTLFSILAYNEFWLDKINTITIDNELNTVYKNQFSLPTGEFEFSNISLSNLGNLYFSLKDKEDLTIYRLNSTMNYVSMTSNFKELNEFDFKENNTGELIIVGSNTQYPNYSCLYNFNDNKFTHAPKSNVKRNETSDKNLLITPDNEIIYLSHIYDYESTHTDGEGKRELLIRKMNTELETDFEIQLVDSKYSTLIENNFLYILQNPKNEINSKLVLTEINLKTGDYKSSTVKSDLISKKTTYLKDFPQYNLLSKHNAFLVIESTGVISKKHKMNLTTIKPIN